MRLPFLYFPTCRSTPRFPQGLRLLSLAFALASALLFPAAPSHSADDANGLPLTILTEEFPPYNFTQDGSLKGISTEILEMTLREAGFSLPSKDFQVLPWSRAYQEALTLPDALLYSVTRTREREHLFKWVGPIAPNRNVLVARKDRGIMIRQSSDLPRFKAGAIRDDAGEQLLLANGYPASQLDLAADARSNLLKLDSGRIDLFAYPETVFKWIVRQSGKKIDDYETVFVLHDGYVYFALNRNIPDEIVDRLQKALDQLKESGHVQAVIDRYLD